MDPAAGGPSEFVRQLIHFGPSDYEGEVVTMDAPGSAFLDDIPFPVHALGPGKGTFAYSKSLYPWLRDNRHRFDGVIINGLWQYIGYAAWRALHGKTPYMVFPHGMLDPYFKRAFPRKHLKKWLYWVPAEYRVLRDAYRVLFTTRDESQLAEQSFWLHRWNGYVVPFGATRPPADGNTLREAFLAQQPHLRDKRFMLFLGRIHLKKGCDMLIQSFARLAGRDPELHLVMAGPDQQGLMAGFQDIIAKAGLSERVHWPGMIHGDAKWGAFFAAEVFILPSHQENFGIAVAEALGCGLPVLLGDKVNIAPEIDADHAGLMEPDTQAGTDALVSRWMHMPAPRRNAMRVQALATFLRRYDMETNAATILRLFEGATADRQPDTTGKGT